MSNLFPVRTLYKILLPVLLITGCSESVPVWEVSRRLGPSVFGFSAVRRASMETVGDQARPVLIESREFLVHEELFMPVEGELVRIPIPGAEEVLGRPDTNFRLSLQTLPLAKGLPKEVMRDIANKTFWRRISSGWRILPPEGDSMHFTLEIRDPSFRKDTTTINLRLTASQSSPAVLRSKNFAIATNSRIRLAWALPFGGETRARGNVTFRAKLECDDSGEHHLLEHEIRGGSDDAGHWHQQTVPIAEAAGSCRLVLEASPDGGGGLEGALWAWPEILTVASADERRRTRNLVLISLDTLRADHLSGYGYRRPTSPQIDSRLIDAGTLFENVSSTFPQTDISHISLFTGLYPAAQPVRGRLSAGMAITTLAESLQSDGFHTAAITENALVSGAFGFWFGFDQFTERSFIEEKLGPTSFAEAEVFLRENRDERFFLFLHTYQTHDPFDSSEDYQELWKDDGHWNDGGPRPRVPQKHRELVDAYDRTIREADDLVGNLLNTLEDLALDSSTLVVLLSDHGESFGEHGIPGHGFQPHEEQLRVPLIFRGPNVPAGRRVGGPASLTDVAPTILDLLELPNLEQGQGQSLTPVFRAGNIDADRQVYFSWFRPKARGARTASRKILQTETGSRAYELDADPFERKPNPIDLRDAEVLAKIDQHAHESARLRERLHGDDLSLDEPSAISQQTEDSLRALGYID